MTKAEARRAMLSSQNIQSTNGAFNGTTNGTSNGTANTTQPVQSTHPVQSTQSNQSTMTKAELRRLQQSTNTVNPVASTLANSTKSTTYEQANLENQFKQLQAQNRLPTVRKDTFSATGDIDESVYEKGNPITQSIMKIQNFAKDNNLSLKSSGNKEDDLADLYSQSSNLDKSKRDELAKYIRTYHKVKQEDVEKANYLGNKAISGAVNTVGGAIDAVIGTANKLSPSNIMDNLKKKYYEKNLEYYNFMDTFGRSNSADKIAETQAKIKAIEDNQKARAQKSKEQLSNNIIGATGESLKKRTQEIEQAQNVGTIKKLVGDVVEGVSGMAPTIVLSTATANPQLALNVMSSSAGGNAYRQAINDGYNVDQAFNYGALMAAKEYATEKMFGTANKLAGFDVAGYGDELSESVLNLIFQENGNKILKGITEYAMGGLEEGLEEFVGDIVEPYISNLTLGTQEKANLKNALYSGLVGGITGLAMSTPGTVSNAINNVKSQNVVNNTQNIVEKSNTQPNTQKAVENQNNVAMQQTNQVQSKNENITQNNEPISQQTSENSQDNKKTYQTIRTDVENAKMDATKPQGLYVSNVTETGENNFTFPFKDKENNTTYRMEVTPNNPLEVDSLEMKTSRSEMPIEVDVGVSALKQLVGEQEFSRINSLSKQELINELNEKFPGADYKKYYDKLELMSAYGAQVARQQGYDAIVGKSTSDIPGVRDVQNEIAVLDDKIIKQVDNFESNKGSFLLPNNEQLSDMENKKSQEASSKLQIEEPSSKLEMEEPELSLTEKRRKFVDTSRKSPNATEDFSRRIVNRKDAKYTPISNKETLASAKETLNNNPNAEIDFLSNDLKTAEDTAIGDLLIQKAWAEGDTQRAVTLTLNLAEKLTNAGQMIQAASLIKRLTPEGMLMYAEKQLSETAKTIKKENPKFYNELKKKGIIIEEGKKSTFSLTDEEMQTIKTNMEKAQKMEDGDAKNKLINQTMNLIANKIPSTALEKVAALRRSGLLMNIKTLNRNVGSNAVFGGMEQIKDIPAAMVDRLVAVATGQRTTTLPSLSAYGKGFKKGAIQSIVDLNNGQNFADKKGKYSIGKGGKTFKRLNTYNEIITEYKQGKTKQALKDTFNRLLSDYEDVSTFIVDGTDKPFWQGRFEQELQRQMKLNNLEYGVDLPTNDMLEIARDEADYATFKNKNIISDTFGALRRTLNAGKDIGIADALGFTFTNVPGSVASKVYDYSIGGYLNATKQLVDIATKGTEFNQRKFVDGLARSMTGTGLIGLAAYLVSKGILRGSADDDKDIANLEKQMGYQVNSLNVSALKRLIKGEDTSVKEGDEFYTFDWNQPFSSTFIIGADMYNAYKEGKEDLDIAWTGAKTMIDQVMDMSSLSNVKDLFSSYEGAGDTILNVVSKFPSSFIPTIFNNIAQFKDENARVTTSSSKKERFINQLKYKIPGIRETLPQAYDTLGNEKKQYKEGNDFLSTFVDPGYKTKYTPTKLQNELMDIYKETGEKGIFPIQVGKSFQANGETTKLNSEQLSIYQKATGEYSNKVMNELVESDAFATFSNVEKAEILKQVVEDSNIVGKNELGVQTSKYDSYKKKIEQLDGVSLADYYMAYEAQKNAEGKKNAKGDTIKGSKKKAQKQAIIDLGLDTKDKDILYGIFNLK